VKGLIDTLKTSYNWMAILAGRGEHASYVGVSDGPQPASLLQVEQSEDEEAAGANDQVAEGTTDILNPDDMRLTYPLRRDRHVDLILPRDITPNEAQRLSDFIKTLQFE
jgi:hypothetical protein